MLKIRVNCTSLKVVMKSALGCKSYFRFPNFAISFECWHIPTLTKYFPSLNIKDKLLSPYSLRKQINLSSLFKHFLWKISNSKIIKIIGFEKWIIHFFHKIFQWKSIKSILDGTWNSFHTFKLKKIKKMKPTF